MEEKVGIENLKPIVALSIEAINVTVACVTQKSVAPLINITDEVFALGSVNFGELGKEISDLDAAEREELFKFVEEKFDIPQDDIEVYIEKGLRIAAKLAETGIEIYELVTEIKSEK